MKVKIRFGYPVKTDKLFILRKKNHEEKASVIPVVIVGTFVGFLVIAWFFV